MHCDCTSLVRVRERSWTSQVASRQSREAGIARGNGEVSGADCLVPAVIRIPLSRLSIPLVPSFVPSSLHDSPSSSSLSLFVERPPPPLPPPSPSPAPPCVHRFFPCPRRFLLFFVSIPSSRGARAAKLALLRNLISGGVIAAIVAPCRIKGDVLDAPQR